MRLDVLQHILQIVFGRGFELIFQQRFHALFFIVIQPPHLFFRGAFALVFPFQGMVEAVDDIKRDASGVGSRYGLKINIVIKGVRTAPLFLEYVIHPQHALQLVFQERTLQRQVHMGIGTGFYIVQFPFQILLVVYTALP